ncbi:hypothetical protein [Methylocystis hirsuta]|uniref:hypothetical protein n=1 Tax=Methylocystis hirsuta TaxID=369798 RepID=UPI0011CE5F84|nr:hypothetical protein [Methylocystis hirsuta]
MTVGPSVGTFARRLYQCARLSAEAVNSGVTGFASIQILNVAPPPGMHLTKIDPRIRSMSLFEIDTTKYLRRARHNWDLHPHAPML